MSAQAGVWNFDGKPVDESFLAKLSLAIEPMVPTAAALTPTAPLRWCTARFIRRWNLVSNASHSSHLREPLLPGTAASTIATN